MAEAWRARSAPDGTPPSPLGPSVLKRLLENYKNSLAGAAKLEYEFRNRRLYLRLDPPGLGLRPQDVIREAFGIDNPVFLLRRDDVVLKSDRN